MIRTDLHGHSFFSDGRVAPEKFVELRAEENLEVIALSDHDSFAGVARAEKRARELGLTLVPAMECTSFIGTGDLAEQVHVLAYFPRNVPYAASRLAERARIVGEKWRAFVAEWEWNERVDLGLAALPGLQACISGIIEIDTDDPNVARAHAARRMPLWQKFHAHHVRFWDDPLFRWSPEEAIDEIRANGAVDVIAHPNRIRDKERMERALDYATGVEVYTSRHNAEISARFLDYAQSRAKLWTASTDDHQQAPYRAPASGMPREFVERLVG